MQINLWLCSGDFFGYRDNDNLWTHFGKLAGQFRGNEVFGADGAYLGEVHDKNRLLTKSASKGKRSNPFAISQGVSSVQSNLSSCGVASGCEDSPKAESFR